MAAAVVGKNAGPVKDETGKLFGFLKVISRAENASDGSAQWLCACTYKECKNTRTLRGTLLRTGKVVSCGCYNRELVAAAARTHGCTGHVLYEPWKSMIHRCYRPDNDSYSSHGGRGIIVCDRWKQDPNNFIADMMPGWELLPKDGTVWTLDRKDVNGNYTPENCKWASHKEQQNNKRNNHLIEFEGVIKTAAQWGEIYGLDGPAIIGRIKLGWTVEKALKDPLRKHSSRPESMK